MPRYLCPKCNSVLSQAEYHLSNSDYFAVCLDCDEDFYQIEVVKEELTNE